MSAAAAAAAAAAGEFSLTGVDRLEPGTKVEEILFREPFTALSDADSWSEMGWKEDEKISLTSFIDVRRSI